MRRAGTSDDAYVTQNWRTRRFVRSFVTLIRDELTVTLRYTAPSGGRLGPMPLATKRASVTFALHEDGIGRREQRNGLVGN